MWDVRGECEREILWCGGYVMHCSSCGHWLTHCHWMNGASGSVGQIDNMIHATVDMYVCLTNKPAQTPWQWRQFPPSTHHRYYWHTLVWELVGLDKVPEECYTLSSHHTMDPVAQEDWTLPPTAQKRLRSCKSKEGSFSYIYIIYGKRTKLIM